MPVKTNSQLAAFFNTGDQPSEAEFGHLIDTIQPPHVTLGDESKTLTVADHAYRLLIMPNISGARTLTLPTPILDTWFHIVSLPLVTDGNTLTIKGTDESHFLHGSVVNYELDIDEYNEICIMKQDSNVLDDDDFRKYLKYKYLNIDIKHDTSDEVKTNVFQEIGFKPNRDVWNKNIQFKRFVETILMEDNIFEPVNIDKRIEETIMKWGKVGDKAEIQQKYLIRWKYLFGIMNDMGFVKDQRIEMKPFMTHEYDKLIDKYKTISYRSLTQIFDDNNLRMSNVKDDKIVNFTTKQMNGIFRNLLSECLGLTLKKIGRKKIKGRENTIFDFFPDSKDELLPMSENYYNLIKYKHKPEKKRYKFKKVLNRLK